MPSEITLLSRGCLERSSCYALSLKRKEKPCLGLLHHFLVSNCLGGFNDFWGRKTCIVNFLSEFAYVPCQKAHISVLKKNQNHKFEKVLDSQEAHESNKDTRNELLFMQAYSRQPNLQDWKPDKVSVTSQTMTPAISWASIQQDITKEKLKKLKTDVWLRR